MAERHEQRPKPTAWQLEVGIDALLDLIADLTDEADCRYDHHDYCQTHALDERPCPHERAKGVLAIREEKRACECGQQRLAGSNHATTCPYYLDPSVEAGE